MNITIKIDGLDTLVKNLQSPRVKEKFVDAANRSVSLVKMRSLVEVPVDTSQLQKSHILEPATPLRLSAEVYTELEYAVPVHEGHRIVAWGHDTGRKQPPNPWMQRAADKSGSQINQIFDQAADEVAQNLTK